MAEPENGGELNVPLRVQFAVYGAAMFSFSMIVMVNVIIPLWVVMLGASPLMVGIVLGARHFLILLFSIHGGVLMDRFGIRRIMLAFTFLAAIVPLLIPVSPLLPWLIVLQMIGGFADSIGWMGAQAATGKMMKGDPVYVGRMTFAIRIGQFGGPLLVGWAWDALGPWGAFGTMSLWSACGFACAVMLPEPARSAAARAGTRIRLSDLLPRWSDYVVTFKLAGSAAVALVLMATMLRLGGTGIQSSFYVVYLSGIGISATQIGFLISISGLCGGLGGLVVGRATGMFSAYWMMLVAAGLSVAIVSITPLLGSFVLLVIASCLRGGILGIGQPLEISILGKSLSGESQGKGVGLRTAANRGASLLVPVAMGGVAELAGIENSFYVIGAAIVALLALVAVFLKRTPSLR